jgi:hypothetical protein
MRAPAPTLHDRRLWAAQRRLRTTLRGLVEDGWKLARGRKALGADPYRDFVERYTDALEQAYREAWLAGSGKAGVEASAEAAAEAGRIAATQDQPYVLRFASDLILGDRYTEGELDWPFARAELYVKRVRGVGNEAFHAHSPSSMTFEWVLGEAEHCEDCPRLAANSPYAWHELGVFPGDGSTACLGQCKCHIVREDGVAGLLPEDIEDGG